MRIDELSFPHPAALYRGEGEGVAVVRRHAPLDAGPSWAHVVESADGIPDGFVYLEYHAGSVQAFSVDGGAAADLPGRADLDPRLHPLGEYIEGSDVDAARADDASLGRSRTAARDAIRAGTFRVVAVLDGVRWAAEVGPAAFGTTSLVLTGTGRTLVLETDADRAVLEGARQAPTRISATESVARRFGSGRTRRTVIVDLEPAS